MMKTTKPKPTAAFRSPLLPSQADVDLILAGNHWEPHRVLGAHPGIVENRAGAIIRAFHPDATGVDCLAHGTVIAMERIAAGGLFAAFIPEVSPPTPYRLRFLFRDGHTWEREDPYRFLPTIGELDLHLF